MGMIFDSTDLDCLEAVIPSDAGTSILTTTGDAEISIGPFMFTLRAAQAMTTIAAAPQIAKSRLAFI